MLRKYLIEVARGEKSWISPKIAQSILTFHISKGGIWFYYKSDEVIWVFPWKRIAPNKVYVSLGFSGTGEWGDAYFPTLRSMDEAWEAYNKDQDEWNERNQGVDFEKILEDFDKK